MNSDVHSESPSAPLSEKMVKRNRFFGFMMILIIIVPMIIAYIMFKTGLGLTGGTTNKGILLTPPQNIQSLILTNDKSFFSDLYAKNEHGKKWRLVVPVNMSCEEACQNNLYLTRQVHIRLAEKGYRVERVIVQLASLSASMQQFLATDHRNIVRVKSSSKDFSQWLSATNAPERVEDVFYLVDQEGFAMMYYNQSHSGQDLLDDIKKLLKFTYDK